MNSSSLRKDCLSHILLCSKASICEAHRTIARLRFRAYITTNYDTFIENSFEEKDQPIKTLYDIQIEEALEYRENGQQFVLKLCGDINRPDLINLIDVDLEKRFKSSTHPLSKGPSLRNLLSSYHLLCIGFQPNYPGLACLENLCKEGIFHKSVNYWIAVPEEHKLGFARVSEQSQNIHIIPYSPDEGLAGFLKQLERPSSKQNADRGKSKQEKSEQRLLETVANGEDSQNGSAQSPYPQKDQDEDDYQAVSISYVNFTLWVDSNNAIRSESDKGQQNSVVPVNELNDIQLATALIEEGKMNEILAHPHIK